MLLANFNRKEHLRHRAVSLRQHGFLVSFTFSLFFCRQMTAGAVTALTFRKLKQITIKESLGVGKTRCIARFPCDSTELLFKLLFTGLFIPGE